MVYPPRDRPTALSPKQTRRFPLVLMAVLTTGAGVLSAVSAAAASGPFAGLRPIASHLVNIQLPTAPIDARILYPAPSPAVIHKVVDMFDLPAVPRAPISAPAPAPADIEHSSNGRASDARTSEGHSKGSRPPPSPPANSSPSPSPPPGGGDG